MTHTNTGLAEHARKALREGWFYGWGDFGRRATKSTVSESMFKEQTERWREYMSQAIGKSRLRGAKTVLEASNVVLFQYERPADQSAAVQAKRAEYGQEYFDRFSMNTAAASPAPSSILALKPNDEIAREVIRGLWGNGQERRNLLTAAGYDAAIIQARVNQLLR